MTTPEKLTSSATIERKEKAPRFRFAVIGTLWITAIFLYFDRVNISMAAPHIMEDLSLSAVQMSLILSMFSWGFMPGQVLGGYIADRYSVRKWAIFWYAVWCAVTFLTGLCRNLGQFIIVRFLFGFAEGTVINQVNKIQNHWAFPNERGFVNGGLMFSAYLGLVVGTPLVAWLISVFGWREMFFISGAITIVGVLLFSLMVYDYPKDHPWISAKEKEALETSLSKDRVNYNAQQGKKEPLSFSNAFKTLLANRVYWAMCGAFFFVNMIYYTNFSWLPGYLQIERGFTNLSSATALIFPYMAAAAGALSGGIISDKLGNRCIVIIVTALLTMPAITGLLLIDNPTAIIITTCLMMFFNAAAVSTFVVLLFDLFPAEVIGVGLAVMAGVCGGFGGVVGPLLMGFSYDLTGSFYSGFVCLGAGMIVSVILMSWVFKHERLIKIQKKQLVSAN